MASAGAGDPLLAELVIAQRCELALGGPALPDDDPIGFLLGVGQLVRMGEQADPWMPDVAQAVEVAGKGADHDWDLVAALDAADIVFAAAGDRRARRDLASLRSRVRLHHQPPDRAPQEPSRMLAWTERLRREAGTGFPAKVTAFVRETADGIELLPGFPPEWLGQSLTVDAVPFRSGTLSFAVRWHGARPAVLWEQSGMPVALSSPRLAPDWATSEVKGEALWPEPVGLLARPPAEGESFS